LRFGFKSVGGILNLLSGCHEPSVNLAISLGKCCPDLKAAIGQFRPNALKEAVFGSPKKMGHPLSDVARHLQEASFVFQGNQRPLGAIVGIGSSAPFAY
jgi:hypothetical protein